MVSIWGERIFSFRRRAQRDHKATRAPNLSQEPWSLISDIRAQDAQILPIAFSLLRVSYPMTRSELPALRIS